MKTFEELKVLMLNRTDGFITDDKSYRMELEKTIRIIRDYWKESVPKIYLPVSEHLNQTFDEQMGRNLLIQPLEWYITKSENPKELLNKLKSVCKPPELCGHVFRVSEPNYSCRDCSTDPTCVLCVNCFKNSEHRNHRYRIGTSSSGYCDCGDVEAWKSHPHCFLHAKKMNNEEFETSLANIMDPIEFDQMVKRLSIVISLLLDYCYALLKYQHGWVPPELSLGKLTDPSVDTIQLVDGTLKDKQYVAVVYNDETHTFEQVIYALNKSIRCDNKIATDYATAVDREGRCIIYLGPRAKCEQVAAQIDDITKKNSEKALKVRVLCTYLMSHQTFTTRLLTWILEILPICEKFRVIFSEYLYRESHLSAIIHFNEYDEFSRDFTLVEKIMLSDVKFWKSIRVQWHQLFMSGLFLDMELKKQFSKFFVRNYHHLLTDYMHDDQDYRVSILALAVQIFTVPSISQVLIEEENAITLMLESFLDANFLFHKSGRFKLDPLLNHHHFRRSQLLLRDLSFLLTKGQDDIPWTDKMRDNFVKGIEAFVKLLKRMHNMDSVVRQISHHIEYEQGWEMGINFQMKVAPIMKSLVEWSATDRQVYIRSLNVSLKYLKIAFDHSRIFGCDNSRNSISSFTQVCLKICNHSAFAWEYDVSRKEMSIHTALVRFVSGMLLHLPKFNISYTYDYNQELMHERLLPESLIEYPLRTQVLIGQFRGGMWRRNGYSLINQILFYFNVRLRDEMYDRDVLMLQIGASMLDPNEYLIHVLNKFNLLFLLDSNNSGQFQKSNNDDTIRQTITLIEEFLRLIYVVLAERYVIGLGEVTLEDCIKREIIQWLCKDSMSNSELLSHLPCDFENGFEDYVLKVADFRKPPVGATTHGKYVLKEDLYAEFNPFFYHYSRQEQSSAFESQLKRKKQKKERYICCPPPHFPPFLPEYKSIVNLLNCDIMFTLIRTILEKTCDLCDNLFSDIQFQQVLYLIGVALNEELKNPQRFQFASKAIEAGIVSLLERCNSRHILPRIEMHKDLLGWVFDRFKEVAKLNQSNSDQCSEDILSKMPSGTSKEDDTEQSERNKRRAMAEAMKSRIMARIETMQKNFMKENANYFESQSNDSNASSSNQGSMMDLTTISPHELNMSGEEQEPVAIGIDQCRVRSISFVPEMYTCILCLEQHDINAKQDRFLLLAAFVQKSTVLSKNRTHQSWLDEGINPVFVRSDHNYGPYVNTCTHYMHNDCFNKYIETAANNERRRSTGRHPRVSYDITKNEFLCPLCECLCNMVIPIMPKLESPIDAKSIKCHFPMDKWLTALHSIVLECNSIWINKVDSIVNVKGFEKIFSETIHALSSELRLLFKALRNEYSQNIQPHIDTSTKNDANRSELVNNCYNVVHNVTCDSQKIQNLGHVTKPHEPIQCMNWSIAYSIQVLERLMRLEKTPFCDIIDTRHYHCLKAMTSMVRAQLNFQSTIHSRRILLWLLNYLLVNTVYLSSPFSCLDLDAFTLLVTLLSCTPAFFDDSHQTNPDSRFSMSLKLHLTQSSSQCHNKDFMIMLGNSFDKNLIEMILVFHMVQIILTNPNLTDCEEPMEVDSLDLNEKLNDPSEHCVGSTSSASSSSNSNNISGCDDSDTSSEEQFCALASFCNDVLIAAGRKVSPEQLSKVSKLNLFIKSSLLPFLRSASIFVFFMTDVRLPKVLWSKPKDCAVEKFTPIEEYESLCKYLGIASNFATLLQSSSLRHLALSWTRHLRIPTLFISDADNVMPTTSAPTNMVVSGHSSPVLKATYQFLRQPHTINHLQTLPNDYADLINSVANFTCPNSNGKESRSPTMCLVCGEILCSQNYCCQKRLQKELVGACTHHAQQCGAGVGIFLRIRDCKILLLATRSRGCYLPSPYVDKYGETDQGLLRGDPQFLSTTAYEHLYKLWFRHAIPEQIVHMLESSISLSATNWNMM